MALTVLFLGTLTSDQQNAIFIQNGIRPAPADIVQEYLLKGLCENQIVDRVEAICAPRIRSYPKSRVLHVKKAVFNKNNCAIQSVDFLNLPIIGFFQRERNIVSACKKWAKKQDTKKEYIVLLYSMHSPFLRAAKAIKELLPNAKIGMIVPDLPQYMSTYNKLLSTLKKVDEKRIKHYLPTIDKYILYTRHMADYFSLLKDQWMVCEGLMDVSKISLTDNHKKSENVVIYAGSLSPQYAIDKLILAFENITVDAELHLYGDPVQAEMLMQQFEECKKTKYMGCLPQAEMFCKMKDAVLLVNPRPSNLELTKYSCPSKTFEYMASGVPVLMTRLPGLPEEYEPYLFFFESEDVDGFSHTLEHVLSMDSDSLHQKGQEAAKYLLENKSSNQQVERIVSFLK